MPMRGQSEHLFKLSQPIVTWRKSDDEWRKSCVSRRKKSTGHRQRCFQRRQKASYCERRRVHVPPKVLPFSTAAARPSSSSRSKTPGVSVKFFFSPHLSYRPQWHRRFLSSFRRLKAFLSQQSRNRCVQVCIPFYSLSTFVDVGAKGGREWGEREEGRGKARPVRQAGSGRPKKGRAAKKRRLRSSQDVDQWESKRKMASLAAVSLPN